MGKDRKMFKTKKSFTLFSTLILIFVFSILVIKIFETKAISSQNIINQYEYIQAKNHLQFLEEYISSLKSLDTTKSIKIKDKMFDINAHMEKKGSSYEANLYVKDFKNHIRVHKTINISL